MLCGPASARGARAPVHVVVAATDYQGFAILCLERARQLSVKLYGGWWPVSTRGLGLCPRKDHHRLSPLPSHPDLPVLVPREELWQMGLVWG